MNDLIFLIKSNPVKEIILQFKVMFIIIMEQILILNFIVVFIKFISMIVIKINFMIIITIVTVQ